MSRPLAELRAVTRRFGAATDVLRGVDLEVYARDTLAVLGPSGCGKSTLLHVLGGLLPPTSGVASFDGRDLSEMSAAERAALRNRDIGFVFQAHHLLPQCTALENVLVPTLVHPQRSGAEARARGAQYCACRSLRQNGYGQMTTMRGSLKRLPKGSAQEA